MSEYIIGAISAERADAHERKPCRPCSEKYLTAIRANYLSATKREQSARLDEAVRFTGYARDTVIRKLNSEPAPAGPPKPCRPCIEKYLTVIRPDYLSATKREQSARLDEAVRFTGYARGTVIRKLNSEPAPAGSSKSRPGRSPKYGQAELAALLTIRKYLDFPNERKLVGSLPSALASLERYGDIVLDPGVRERLLEMSSATAGLLLRRTDWRSRAAIRPRRPLTRLQAETPLRTWDSWDGARPGDLQVDIVFHSGPAAGGSHLYTLVASDPCTGWIEAEVLLRLRQDLVADALERIRVRLPFRWRSLHSDNGSELLNGCVAAWCAKHGIVRTRGRPGKPNDQAYAEQRNRTFVRRLVGDFRFCGPAACKALAALYAPAANFANFFDAKTSKRHGGRAKTPHERLTESGVLGPDEQRDLDERFANLRLAMLREEIDRRVDGLARHATHNPPRPR